MTAEILSAGAGILLSLLFSYIPGLSTWYTKQDGTTKRLVMLGALAALALGVQLLSCIGVSEVLGVLLPACTKAGIQSTVEMFILALVTNQATYLISPEVKQSKVVSG